MKQFWINLFASDRRERANVVSDYDMDSLKETGKDAREMANMGYKLEMLGYYEGIIRNIVETLRKHTQDELRDRVTPTQKEFERALNPCGNQKQP